MNIKMKSAQTGFTLIELVVVIVILGILAATALPKFIDLTGNANQAAVQGVAGGLSSASSINYGGCAVAGNPVGGNKTTCLQVAKCSDVGNLLNPALTLTNPSAAGQYSITADNASTTNGTAVSCILQLGTGTNMVTATYSAVGAGN